MTALLWPALCSHTQAVLEENMPWLWQCLPRQRAFSSTRTESRFFKITEPGPAPVGTSGASSQRSWVLSSSPRGRPGAGPSCLGEACSVSPADPCTPAGVTLLGALPATPPSPLPLPVPAQRPTALLPGPPGHSRPRWHISPGGDGCLLGSSCRAV